MGAGILQALIPPPRTPKIIFSNQSNLQFSWNPVRFHGSIPNSAFRRTFRSLLPIFRASGGNSNQVEAFGSEGSGDPNSGNVLTWAQPLLKFAKDNFLPLALVSGVALGLANPTLGCLLHKYGLSKVSTFGIFLISGLMLRSGEIGAAASAWPAGMIGLGSILFFSPFFSKLILKLQLAPREFVTGLAIFCCMPTTLSSGVALTQLVGGNSALALAMTIISNLFGILIVPFSLSKFVAGGVGVTIPTKQLFKSLVITLLVPLIIGKVLRNTLSRINALAVQLLSAIFGREKSVFSKKENARPLIIVSSQKTLPVMVAVVEQLGGALGEPGLLVLPCVAAHINQIIMDSFLVNFWLQKDRFSELSKEL